MTARGTEAEEKKRKADVQAKFAEAEYWQWVTSSGEVLLVEEMTSGHLTNTIHYLTKALDHYNKPDYKGRPPTPERLKSIIQRRQFMIDTLQKRGIVIENGAEEATQICSEANSTCTEQDIAKKAKLYQLRSYPIQNSAKYNSEAKYPSRKSLYDTADLDDADAEVVAYETYALAEGTVDPSDLP